MSREAMKLALEALYDEYSVDKAITALREALAQPAQEPMNYEDIKTFTQRCEEHQDHQQGMVSYDMLQQRLWEEIDELRAYIETKLKENT